MSDEFVPYLKGPQDNRQHRVYNAPDPVEPDELTNKRYVDGKTSGGGGSSVTLGVPSLTLSTTNAIGTSTSAVASDATIVAFDATAPSTQAFGDAAATGSAAVTARRDHKHAMPANPVAYATPSFTLSTANSAGSSTSLVRSDATLLAFDATVPVVQAIGDSAAAGSANVAARRDHTHGMPGFAAPTFTLSTANSAGTSVSLVRSDAQLAIFDTTVPVTQAFADVAAAGTAAFAARRDHTHGMPTVASSRLSLGVRDWKQLSVFGTSVIGESIPRWSITNNGSILNSGRLSFTAVPVLAGDVLTSAGFLSGTTALSAQTHWWFAYLNSTFNVFFQSADQTNTGTWAANSAKTLVCDRVPVTAGARVASTTVTLTFPTLAQPLSTYFAVNDSIVVANANIAAYNGTFTVATVTSTQITYVSGGSATDTLAAPFPTVQPAAGKRTYTVAADAYVYAVVMVAGTVPTLINFPSTITSVVPVIAGTDGTNTGLTGTCPSPSNASTGLNNLLACAVL